MMRLLITRTLAAGVLVAGSLARAQEPGWRTAELYAAFYGYAVCEYCGLVTPAVHEGFRLQRDALIAQGGLSATEVQRLRSAADIAADHEWGNRGLGGFRGWCRTEGLAAAERFLGYRAGPVPDPRPQGEGE